jgi:hypothetical protein
VPTIESTRAGLLWQSWYPAHNIAATKANSVTAMQLESGFLIAVACHSFVLVALERDGDSAGFFHFGRKFLSSARHHAVIEMGAVGAQ